MSVAQGQASGAMRGMLYLAVALNGFAIVAVNYWVYHAIALFAARHGQDYGRPATISRSISDPSIGEPFHFWIAVSGVCLVIGVAILVLYYARLSRLLERPTPYLRFGLRVLLPIILILQVSSAVGMYVLSAFRFPDAGEMHMMGSYQFFGSQALVVLFNTLLSHALLRDQTCLDQLHEAGALHRGWVRVRFWVGCGSVGLVLVYLGLFVAKDIWPSDVAPALYWTYTKTEPAVISGFLLVLGLAHLDLFRRRSREP